MKLLIIDDHRLFADGLAYLLERMDQALTVLKAGNCREAFQQAAEHSDIKLALLDLGLPDISGFDALPVFRERYPEIPVVVLSARDDRDSVLHALEQGAMGYIPKTSSEEILADALRVIFGGGVYLPRSVLGQPPWSVAKQPESDRSNAPLSQKSPLRPVDLGLTPRETDVLRLLIEGKPNKTIGRELNIAESTVKSHAQSACRKLNVTRRTEAIVAVARTGLILSTRNEQQH